MSRRTLLSVLGVVLLTAGAFQACGTPVYDGLPVSITPPVFQVRVNKVSTILVSLSKPREKEGTLYIIIDDTSVLLPAAQKTEIKVPAGASSVPFSFQGIKAGTTNIRARMDNEGEAVSAQVRVVPQ